MRLSVSYLSLVLTAAMSPLAVAAPTKEPAPANAAGAAASTGDVAAAAVAAPDRDAADKALDAGRHPAEMLRFFGITSGMRVGEIAAAGGYTSELLARAVGPTGQVYGHNSPAILEKFAQKPWTARLAKPVNKRIVRFDAPFETPFPVGVKDLDAVVDVLFYHDTVWLKVDRPQMNKAIFGALKSGGVYGIIDHASRPGRGLTEVQTLHRIEESTLRHEVEQVGFKFVGSADFLRSPADTMDWSTSPSVAGAKRGSSDRFVLKFVKP